VRAAYLSQQVAELDPAARVREVVEEVRRVVDLGNHRSLTASQLLDRFGFTGDRQWTPVRDLSGGERRRLQLLRLLMEEPNVLLLDEPTNDLDIDTLTALEDLLDGWAGTLLVASHDRYFLERVTDRTIALFDDGQLRELPGGVEEYLRRRPAAQAAADQPPVGGAREAPDVRTASDVRAARKELARMERALDRLAERERRLHEELAAHATDHERVLYLDTQLKATAAEREQLEETWLALADAAPANTHHGGR
jgi:ATP-binding cassette subfamily F protein uup